MNRSESMAMGTASKKNTGGSMMSWQGAVITCAFLCVIFFSFYAVTYITHGVAAGSSQSLSSTDISATAVDHKTADVLVSKPQLRSAGEDVKPAESAPVVSENTNKLCSAVEMVVNGTTGAGKVTVTVHHDWAPLGAARFCELVASKYYDDVRFFRVLKNFMAQTGMHGDPEVGRLWRRQIIQDDPVTHSNKRGTVTFAMSGKNTRTTQIFFNTVDNKFLDNQGFAPFASIDAGQDVIDKLYNKYGEGGRGDGSDGKGPSQGRINQEGNAYLNEVFPKLSYIVSARIASYQ